MKLFSKLIFTVDFKYDLKIEDIILKKITEKIGYYFGHFAKIAIWNIKDCKNYENLKSRNIFLGIFFSRFQKFPEFERPAKVSEKKITKNSKLFCQ